ncbi:MAG: OOP family OmpA-OmpF porin [Sulfurimonas sp.]|jgi:OOP family OmpA-OmpF porin
MKYLLTLLILALCLQASDTQPKTSNEFPLIKPISVEEAPVEKTVKHTTQILDSDSDGVLDKQDNCPNTTSGEKVDKFGCLLKKDADKDGVPDKADKCQNTVAGTKVDNKGCELDSDNDGIVDSKDQCKDTSNEFVVDGYGCPQTATLQVNFAPAKYNVSKELVNDLQNFAKFLKDNKGYQVIIYGYTDSIGSALVNKKLSQKRANAVKKALTRYEIKETRLTAVGKGEANPIADNMYKAGRAQNRRIEVELIH